MTQALLPNQYKIVPSLIQQQQGAYHFSFTPEDVAILVNPTDCLNDVCINGCIHLLFSSIKPPDAECFAVFSMHNLPVFGIMHPMNHYGEGHTIQGSGPRTRGSSLSIGHPQLVIGSCALPFFAVENSASLIVWQRRKGGQPMCRCVHTYYYAVTTLTT